MPVKLKKIAQFLKNDYENIWTTKKLPKKYRKVVREKKSTVYEKIIPKLSGVRKILLNQHLTNSVGEPLRRVSLTHAHPNVHFLYSSEELLNKILKKLLKKQRKKQSSRNDFLIKLKERKKWNIFYGNVSKNFFEKVSRGGLSKSKINENLLNQFETRLDVLLYRICFCKNIYTAKQYITHNFVFVNGKALNIPSYKVKPGDVLCINKAKKNHIANELLNYLKNNLSKRRFRFLISFKFLQKYMPNLRYKRSPIFNKFRRNPLMFFKLKLRFLLKLSRRRKSLPGFLWRKLSRKARRKVRKVQNKSNKVLLLETLSRSHHQTDPVVKKFYSTIKQRNPKGLLLKFQIKKSMRCKRSRQKIWSGMRISPMKPLHVEVSFPLLCAIILFSPQKVAFPAIVDMDLLSRSTTR